MGRRIFVHSEALDRDGYPRGCPFDTGRAGKTLELAGSLGILEGPDRRVAAPEPASDALLGRFHTPDYLAALRDAGRGAIDPDRALAAGLGTTECPIFADMYEYSALAAGGTVTGARLIAAGEADVAFNPSGGFHHAHPDRASGFCFINDLVLGAEVLVDSGRRVAFVDIDAHHGDAVQDAFYRRADVLTLSLHQSGETLYPGTGFASEIGEGTGRGYNVNVPLPPGTYDAVYLRAFRDAVFPVVQAFAPEVVIVELGMDTLVGDPLTHLRLTNNTPTEIVETLLGLGVPILATGGGGYHVANTVRGWTLCWSVLCGEHSSADDLSVGMGGVMLQNVDWLGGLRDRVSFSDPDPDSAIAAEVAKTVERIRATVFPLHGL